MYFDSIQNIDSLNTVKDTVVTAVKDGDVFKQITFDPNLISDGNGFQISVIGYLIVFSALLFLYIFFANLARIMKLKLRKKLKSEGKETVENDLSMPGEVSAAISMALHLHFAEVHDFENTILTIKKVQRPYSPWSSKIYGLRELPRKK